MEKNKIQNINQDTNSNQNPKHQYIKNIKKN